MLTETDRVVIIGAGHAGVEFAAGLRQKGFTGSIDLVSDETHLPYHRPPLSKDYIMRRGAPLALRPEHFYETFKVVLHVGATALTIDRSGRTVALSDGSRLPYSHLVLALGARNRVPPIPGIEHSDVIHLRSLSDANRIIQGIDSWKRVVVIGGGFVGLEAAVLLRAMNVEVDVIEMAPRLMQRAVSPIVSQWFLDHHRALGVRIHLQSAVKAVRHAGDGVVVDLDGGKIISADTAILAAGVVANDQLAAAAGLTVDNGVVVDGHLATSDPAISAIGDCAHFPNVQLSAMVRLESVQNATDQARALASRLTGNERIYDTLPWFWSTQGSARLQIAGLASPDLTEVVRGTPEQGPFSVFLYAGDRLQAVESVNAPADHMTARRLLARSILLDPRLAADTAVDLKTLVAP